MIGMWLIAPARAVPFWHAVSSRDRKGRL